MDGAPWQLVVPSEEAEIRVPCSLVSAPAPATAAEAQVPSGGAQDGQDSRAPQGLGLRGPTDLRQDSHYPEGAVGMGTSGDTGVGSETQPFLRTMGDGVEAPRKHNPDKLEPTSLAFSVFQGKAFPLPCFVLSWEGS